MENHMKRSKKLIVLLLAAVLVVLTAVLAIAASKGFSDLPANARYGEAEESVHEREPEDPQPETPTPEPQKPDIPKPEEPEPEHPQPEDPEPENSEESAEMKVQIGNYTFTATLEDNDAAKALKDMLPITVSMHDNGGFEKVGTLPGSLPANHTQITGHEGDIILYLNDQLVLFYGSNSWSYTRLGHIDDLTHWREALGSGNITATLSLE